MLTLRTILPFCLVPLALSKTIQVSVGANGALLYEPEYVQADVDDIINFTFYPNNHTVTQSNFALPCTPFAGGVNSGFFKVASEQTYLPTFQFHVTDTEPVWFHCLRAGHCSRGMVFAINPPPPGSERSFDNFKRLAMNPTIGGPPPPAQVQRAVVNLKGNSTVSGSLSFIQAASGGPVSISGTITGLEPNTLHGMHVHQFGDLTNGCTTTSTHFNPFNQTHGARTDLVRHVGDLGNIQSDGTGTAIIDLYDSVVSLSGTTSIVGRGIVVHAATDDLGQGGNEESTRTGNAGARLACGIIGIAG